MCQLFVFVCQAWVTDVQCLQCLQKPATIAMMMDRPPGTPLAEAYSRDGGAYNAGRIPSRSVATRDRSRKAIAAFPRSG